MYNFNEAKLGPKFAKDKLQDFKQLIDAGLSFVAISMPGVGASYFLKYLACQDFARSALGARRARFFHVDMYSLPSLNLHEFYKLLLMELGGKPFSKSDEELFLESKKKLKEIAQKKSKIVVIFNRFDQLKHEIDANFLSNLQSLTGESPGKIVLIFTAIKPLSEITPDAVTGGNLTFYSKHLYFKPYSESDLKMLLEIDPESNPEKNRLSELIKLSGGHYQLLKILLNSQKQQNLILDQFVKLQMKGLLDYLDFSQKRQIQRIVLGKKIEEIDEYLIGVGMVTRSVILSERSEPKDLYNYQIFTPLLAEYIKTNIQIKLPVKEAKLFKLLRKNMGNVVLKEEIFSGVWGENDENATDWALDALIYRLRKHPFIKSNGYIIESHKKVGYTLIQT